ncbi:tannase and feruloyl esterase-domain-containing protein [Fusarium oxysporum Fo47]|uniref:tannase and feruloyl esterase-domain-containing protein n=1 Tax=Fusarium oxysporum Fo47 TaxID=660027 RepID=UPI0028699875|nr:tannase and feruloyl esterase-domain-containing protein [Fusarium oxysporum Fo47]WJG36198.1 tannase and feruloyl esterase-domain-containing protein [Fusarium oxysporum Fo47]
MSSVTSFASLCDPSQFGYSSLFGAKFSSLQAKLVTNFALDVSLGPGQPNLTYSEENTNFCNVTVTYTHPGYEDAVSVETWLPVDNYNGRLQAIGGSGWVSGRHPVTYWKMASVAGDGYATVTTDAGVEQNLANPDPWALESPGNLNLVALSNFGHVALHDEAVIAKDLIKQLYGKPPAYSYFNGYAYDGIMAAAPAMNWSPFLNQLTALAVSTCEELNLAKGGVITEPEACLITFNPKKHVGEWFQCSDTESKMEISEAAANVALATWHGPTFANGRFLWYGFDIGSDLSSIGQESIATWVRDFIQKDPTSNVTSLTRSGFDTFYRSLKFSFGTMLETGEVDLSDFRRKGGKLITFHGLEVLDFSNGSTANFYQYYRVPGLQHCSGGASSPPLELFSQLRQWVENGTTPNTLHFTQWSLRVDSQAWVHDISV